MSISHRVWCDRKMCIGECGGSPSSREIDEIAALKTKLDQEIRLNAMGQEREARLKAENARLRAGLEEISRVEWVRMTYVDDKQWMEALVRALNSNAAIARKALGRE